MIEFSCFLLKIIQVSPIPHDLQIKYWKIASQAHIALGPCLKDTPPIVTPWDVPEATVRTDTTLQPSTNPSSQIVQGQTTQAYIYQFPKRNTQPAPKMQHAHPE